MASPVVPVFFFVSMPCQAFERFVLFYSASLRASLKIVVGFPSLLFVIVPFASSPNASNLSLNNLPSAQPGPGEIQPAIVPPLRLQTYLRIKSSRKILSRDREAASGGYGNTLTVSRLISFCSGINFFTIGPFCFRTLACPPLNHL